MGPGQSLNPQLFCQGKKRGGKLMRRWRPRKLSWHAMLSRWQLTSSRLQPCKPKSKPWRRRQGLLSSVPLALGFLCSVFIPHLAESNATVRAMEKQARRSVFAQCPVLLKLWSSEIFAFLTSTIECARRHSLERPLYLLSQCHMHFFSSFGKVLPDMT